jgi:predicted RNA methylase
MMALNREMWHAKAASDRERIAKKITAIDKAIDSIVYDLYGLGASEIAVVESQSSG